MPVRDSWSGSWWHVDPIIESVRLTLAPLIANTRAHIVCRPLPAVEATRSCWSKVFQNLIATRSNTIARGGPGSEISGSVWEAKWQFA